MNFLDRIKGIYKTPTANIIPRGERLKLSSQIRNSALLLNIVLEF